MWTVTIARSAWTLSLAICLVAGACSSPATKACRRIASLCEIELSREELSDCIESLDAASALAKIDLGKKLRDCTAEARSCSESLGCAMGVGLAGVSELGSQFQRGLERGRSSEPRSRRVENTPPSEPRPEPRKDTERERFAVRYLTVSARPGTGPMGHNLLVSIELEAASDMPFIAPHVDTSALCGPESDSDKAFFSSLSEAQRGDRRFETVKLFRSGLTSPPTECEITLSLSQGSTPPHHYCFKSGTTSPGKCS